MLRRQQILITLLYSLITYIYFRSKIIVQYDCVELKLGLAVMYASEQQGAPQALEQENVAKSDTFRTTLVFFLEKAPSDTSTYFITHYMNTEKYFIAY